MHRKRKCENILCEHKSEVLVLLDKDLCCILKLDCCTVSSYYQEPIMPWIWVLGELCLVYFSNSKQIENCIWKYLMVKHQLLKTARSNKQAWHLLLTLSNNIFSDYSLSCPKWWRGSPVWKQTCRYQEFRKASAQ